VAERVRVWVWDTEAGETEKTGQGEAEPAGRGGGLEQEDWAEASELKTRLTKTRPRLIQERLLLMKKELFRRREV